MDCKMFIGFVVKNCGSKYMGKWQYGDIVSCVPQNIIWVITYVHKENYKGYAIVRT